MKKFICLTAVLLLLSGCTTAVCRHQLVSGERKSKSGKVIVAEIRGRNFGYFLFYGIPLWSGEPRYPNEKEGDLWVNRVRQRDIRRMLSARAERLGADNIEGLRIRENSSGFWSLWIVWHRSIEGSCVAVRDPEKVRKEKEKKDHNKFFSEI